MIFPPEIFERILFYVDPVVLTRSKTVCKLWKKIIEEILRNNDHWYYKCTEDIPKNLWSALYEKIDLYKNYNDFDRKANPAVWLTMYKLWMKCKNIITSKESVQYIQSLPKHRVQETITSIAVSVKFVGIGTSHGHIYFYNTDNLSGSQVFSADQMDAVRSLMFFNIDEKTIAISCSGTNIITFWDVSARKQIGKNHAYLVCTSHEYYYTCVRNIVTIITPSYVKAYDCGLEDIVAIGADKDEVILYTKYGNYNKFSLEAVEYKEMWKRTSMPNLKIHRYFVFKPDIIVCLAEFGLLGFLVNGREWRIHNIFPTLHGNPTAVALCAQIFVLGLESGDVHIYHIKDYETVDFSTATSKRLTLEYTPVVSLDITVHLQELCLIIAYNKNVYMVKFI